MSAFGRITDDWNESGFNTSTERPLSPIAVIQTSKKWAMRGAAFGQKRTFKSRLDDFNNDFSVSSVVVHQFMRFPESIKLELRPNLEFELSGFDQRYIAL